MQESNECLICIGFAQKNKPIRLLGAQKKKWRGVNVKEAAKLRSDCV